MRIVKVNGLDPVVFQSTPNWFYVGRRIAIRNGQHAGKAWYMSPLANPWKAASEEVPDVLDKYERWLRERIAVNDVGLMALLRSFTHETALGCWCVTLGHNDRSADGYERCHAEIVRRVWREMFQQ